MQKRSASVAAVTCPADLVSIVPETSHAQLSLIVQVYAPGFNGSRGLKFGPDWLLYVAEAGTGGSTSTKALSTHIRPPIGPRTGGLTSTISEVYSAGKQAIVASGLPSVVSNMPPDLLGVADFAFLDCKLYAVLGGGRCSHGNPTIPDAIVEVDTVTGKWKIVPTSSPRETMTLARAARSMRLNFTRGGDFPTLGIGKVVRLKGDGEIESRQGLQPHYLSYLAVTGRRRSADLTSGHSGFPKGAAREVEGVIWESVMNGFVN
jgi:hypothetical protein